jgi:hypothetical protein
MPAQPSAEELRTRLLRSSKFIHWQPHKPILRKERDRTSVPYGRGEAFDYAGKKYTNLVVDEKHFTPATLAQAWGVSVQTIRELFKSEEGVLKIGSNGTRNRRAYKTLRIPESVAERVHTRLSAGC